MIPVGSLWPVDSTYIPYLPTFKMFFTILVSLIETLTVLTRSPQNDNQRSRSSYRLHSMPKTRTMQAKNTRMAAMNLKRGAVRHQNKRTISAGERQWPTAFSASHKNLGKMLSYAGLLIWAGMDDDLVISSSAVVDTLLDTQIISGSGWKLQSFRLDSRSGAEKIILENLPLYRVECGCWLIHTRWDPGIATWAEPFRCSTAKTAEIDQIEIVNSTANLGSHMHAACERLDHACSGANEGSRLGHVCVALLQGSKFGRLKCLFLHTLWPSAKCKTPYSTSCIHDKKKIKIKYNVKI